MFNLTTLDGYFEGPNRDISRHNVDEGFDDCAINEMFPSSGLLLFGRVSYERRAGFWPTPEAIKNDPIVAEQMNSSQKVVLSRNLKKAEWNNTRIVSSAMEDEVRRLKELPGKGIALLGSGSIVSQLSRACLIDEYRILVNPVALGQSTPLFKGMTARLDLKLIDARTFRSGNVLLRYAPAGKEN
jgi:dihydrofolate reductase